MARAGGNKHKKMREAVKALSAAAASLAQAAEALSNLYDVEDSDEDTASVKSDNSGSVQPSDQIHAPIPQQEASVINYESEDSDDEYMDLAREAVRAATAAVTGQGRHTPESKPAPSHMQNNPRFSVTLEEIQERFSNRLKVHESTNTFLAGAGQNEPLGASQTISNERAPAKPTLSAEPAMAASPPPPPPPKTWASLLGPRHPTVGGLVTAETRQTPEGSIAVSTSYSPEPEARAPFKNLKTRWERPTELQQRTLDLLRTGHDMLLVHGNLKSQTHAVLVHCMKTLKQQTSTLSEGTVGVISALIIVPQQTTGRLFLNFGNEIFRDFDLPHKALLLPGGGSDVNTEAEEMSKQRIDILISSPRVFVNHVNSNPNLNAHLAKLRLVIFAGAHELIRSDVFLSFQFNMIKKRMMTRAKSPRQIIIATAGMSEQVEIFANRALKPGYAIVTGADSADNLQDETWDNLLRK